MWRGMTMWHQAMRCDMGPPGEQSLPRPHGAACGLLRHAAALVGRMESTNTRAQQACGTI